MPIDEFGGGIANEGTLDIKNSTITQNTALINGGDRRCGYRYRSLAVAIQRASEKTAENRQGRDQMRLAVYGEAGLHRPAAARQF